MTRISPWKHERKSGWFGSTEYTLHVTVVLEAAAALTRDHRALGIVRLHRSRDAPRLAAENNAAGNVDE